MIKEYIVQVPRQTIVDEMVQYSVHATDKKDALDIIMAGEFDSEFVKVIDSHIKKEWFEHAQVLEE